MEVDKIILQATKQMGEEQKKAEELLTLLIQTYETPMPKLFRRLTGGKCIRTPLKDAYHNKG